MRSNDVPEIVQRLSDYDLEQLEMCNLPPEKALDYAVGHQSLTVCVDDVPHGAFGLNLTVTPAAIWYLGSDDIRYKHTLSFMKLAKRWAAFLNRNTEVANIVPAHHDRTISWLKHLDFEFEDEVYTVNGYAFRRFYRGPLTSHPPQ